MKKLLLFAAGSVLALSASAQTIIAPPTMEAAQAAGYEALWGNYDFGYVLPNEATLVDNDDVKVVMNNGSAEKPGCNVSVASENSANFGLAFNLGSAASFGAAEAFYALANVSAGIKQPYGIFIIDAKKGGDLTIYANRGKNKFTVYVWDTTINEGVGAYAMAASAQVGSDYAKSVTKASVGLIEGHTYWVFGSETGANTLLYQMEYTTYAAPTYAATDFDASKYSDVIVPPTMEAAQTAGYEALWGSYDFGYVIPNETQILDSDNLKVVMNNGSAEKPGCNVSVASENSANFGLAFNLGSAASFGAAEAFYALANVSAGIKQPYGIFTIEAKKGGDLTLFANRGKNKFTVYVWDTTINEGVGAYTLGTSAQVGGDYAKLVSSATVGLIEGHTYWVFGSETGANTLLYAMGFNGYDAPNYAYTGSGSSAINEVIVDQPQSDIIYNIMGQRVDENYKGLVIKNGKKFIQ